ncbi:hypothetical protein F5J12DRAFT_799727 [Pisolithus orientalis]|uniref:uncharacterized protein n=1 Tax=Pisolithus orientalis TaxID=936130 RepID=UPI0022240E45|nr:uncharacterized protein F5J12DRAFT_799727 [Pisolithus orientalis]KAI6033252.1 hypothetical protein F5J12DRAFT_799727 [Pisolithus orientalis]
MSIGQRCAEDLGWLIMLLELVWRSLSQLRSQPHFTGCPRRRQRSNELLILLPQSWGGSYPLPHSNSLTVKFFRSLLIVRGVPFR